MNKFVAWFFGPNSAEKVEYNPHHEGDPRLTPIDEPDASLGAPFNTQAEPPPFEPEVPDDMIDTLLEDSPFYPTRQTQDLSDGKVFVWETNDGEDVEVTDMATPHLFFTLRMIFNHSVPPAFRVGDFKRRKNVDKWPIEYRVQAGREIRRELEKRADYEYWQQLEVKDMLENAEFLSNAQSPWAWLKDVPFRRPLTGAAMADTSAQDAIDRRRDRAKAKRMRRAVRTDLRGFPGKRCMEHRSYAGLRKPRVECHACKQVFNARRRNRRNPALYRIV